MDALLRQHVVATSGMVRLELLGGARDAPEWSELAVVLGGLHQLPVTEETWDEAASIAYELRRVGITVPFTDILIATIAIHADATVLHRDRHFDLIAQHTPLRVESHVSVS